MRKRVCAVAAVAAWTLAGASARADTGVPLWELGAGVGFLHMPYYRGADQFANFLLPLPYIVYRGDVLRSDRGGVRGILFNTDRLELNVSVGGSLPASSKNSDTRAGMPSLDSQFELGPALDWIMWRGRNPGTRVVASFPVRAAIAVGDFPPTMLGWVSDPSLNLDLTDPARFPHAHLAFAAGPLFATRHLNAHYYSVAPMFVTPTRPAFEAGGGYSGWQFTSTLSDRIGRVWIGAFGRYDSVHGAVFDSSPLVRSHASMYGGLGIAYIFKESSRRVPKTETDF